MVSPYLSVKQTAHALAVSSKLVYRMFGKGTLPGLRVEGAIRISREGLDRYIREHSNNEKPPAPPKKIPGVKRTTNPLKGYPGGYRFLRPRPN